MWQLKKLSTNESLNEPQNLPENWGPIFGMSGIQDKLGDLSWLGNDFVDQGWVIVGEESSPDLVEQVNQDIKNFLIESDPMVSIDNISLTKGQMSEWLEYRRLLREIPLQHGFPNTIIWPTKPQ